LTDAGLIAARFLHYVALALAFGSFAYGGCAGRQTPERTVRALRALALWSSLGVALGSLAVLVATVAGLGGSYGAALDSSLWSAVLQETDFGRVWSVRIVLAAALVAVAALSLRRSSIGLRRAGVVLAGGLLATVALTGHAQLETGAAGLLHRVADGVHLLAAAAWIGVLPPLLLLLARTGPGRTVEDPEAAGGRLQAFHGVGLAAVLLLIATGLVNSWFLVGGVDRLFTTLYGGLLLAKLALFVGMLGLAAGNRLRLVPALARELSTGREPSAVLHRLRVHIRTELTLALLVLLAVAALGAVTPAHTPA
jgi:putative copper resistance protein D